MTTASTLRRHGSIKPGGRGVTLSALHPAHRSARSMFPSRVFDPDEVQRVLKTGHQSRKIGKTVMKGRLRGAPIFTLTLEERATCPRSCQVWASCFGNNMQAAERITAGPALEEALWSELADLQRAHPAGFLVRVHVLGDFYSTDYAEFWAEALIAYPALHAFGYTAHGHDSGIGAIVAGLNGMHPDRWAFRFSGWDGPTYGSVVVAADSDTGHVVCPAQTGGTDCCATCALCWHSTQTIAFRRH